MGIIKNKRHFDQTFVFMYLKQDFVILPMVLAGLIDLQECHMRTIHSTFPLASHDKRITFDSPTKSL